MLSKEQFAASTPRRFVLAAALLMVLIVVLPVYGGMKAGLVISDLVEDKLLWRPRGSRVLEGRAARSSTKGGRPREERASPALCRWLRTSLRTRCFKAQRRLHDRTAGGCSAMRMHGLMRLCAVLELPNSWRLSCPAALPMSADLIKDAAPPHSDGR